MIQIAAEEVSTRTRNGFVYEAHSAHLSRLDAIDTTIRLRGVGRAAFATDIHVRQPVMLPTGETVVIGWAVWVEAQPNGDGQGRALPEIVIHDTEGHIIPPGLERARLIGQAIRSVFPITPDCSAMTDEQFAALDALEVEARAAHDDEQRYSRHGW